MRSEFESRYPDKKGSFFGIITLEGVSLSYEVQNGGKPVLNFLQDFPSPGIVRVLLVPKKSDGLLYQFAVIS